MIILRLLGWLIGLGILLVATVSVWLMLGRTAAPVTPVVVIPAPTPLVVRELSYLCNAGHAIKAVFMETDALATTTTPTAPPQSTGTVSVTFDATPPVSLAQTISAAGVRYANADESLVFWTKGRTVMVLEQGKEGTFQGCVEVSLDPGNLPQGYQDGTTGFTLRYPMAFVATSSYEYTGLGPTKSIAGVKFTIPTALATGTNLGDDTYLSVEHVALPTATCTATAFLESNRSGSSTIVTVNEVPYWYASSTGAAAGNRYEEQVFVRSGSEACVAVRYFIHYGGLENYATGTVKAFNRTGLIAIFDAIRDSVILK